MLIYLFIHLILCKFELHLSEWPDAVGLVFHDPSIDCTSIEFDEEGSSSCSVYSVYVCLQ